MSKSYCFFCHLLLEPCTSAEECSLNVTSNIKCIMTESNSSKEMQKKKSNSNVHLIAFERAILVLSIVACIQYANELLPCWKLFIGRSNKSVTVHHHRRLLNITTTRAPSRRERMLFLVYAREKINDAYFGSSRWAEYTYLFCDY